MKLNTVTVRVGGKSYQLSGMENTEHFHQLASFTDRRIGEVSLQNPGLNAEACAVAAALSIADELFKSQQMAARLRAQIENAQETNADET